EDHGGIRIQHLLDALRISLGPCLDVLHRRLRQRQFALVSQPAPDGCVGTAVVIGVSQANHLAVRQLDPTGALNLQQEGFDRIIHPDDGGRLTTRRSRDLGTRVVRDDALAVQLAPHPLAGQFRIDATEIDGEQVLRRLIQGPLILTGALARAMYQRLVIACDRIACRPPLLVEQAPRLQMLFDEGADLRAARGLYLRRRLTYRLPGTGCGSRLLYERTASR